MSTTPEFAALTGSAGSFKTRPASSATADQPSGRGTRAPGRCLDSAIRCLPNHVLPVLVLLCGLTLFAVNAFAADKVLEASQIGSDPVSLTEYFAVLEDPGQNLTLADVQKPEMATRFKSDQAPGGALSYGFTRSTYWLRLSVQNASDRPLERMLEIGNAALTTVQFHQPAADGRYQSLSTGYALPFATRPYPNRFYVLPVLLPAHATHVLYVRLQATDAMIVPGRLWAPSAFHAYERNDYLGQAFYFGMAIAMLLFNLLLYIALRDSIYLLYVGTGTGLTLALAAVSGLAQEWLWPNATQWSDMAHFTGYSLAVAGLLLFMRRMLDTGRWIPRLDRLVKGLCAALLLTPIGFTVSLPTFAEPVVVLYVLTCLLILGISLFGTLRRQRSAYFFLGAFSLLIAGGLLTALRGLGLLPTNMLTVNGLQFGSGLEMILLAFALADRFNEIRREKAKAQKEALLAQSEALKAQNETLLAQAEAQQSQNKTILAQSQLAQSEKMAALGVLIAGVTHEINTPIGAIKSSGSSITDALSHALGNLPTLFQTLDHTSMGLFLSLLNRANERSTPLNSRETRAVVATATQQLDEAGIDGARHKAGILVKLNAQAVLADYLPLLRHPESELILDTASSMAAIIGSTHNINTAVERVAKIVLALKSFSRVNQAAEMQDASLQDGLETVLTIYNYQIKQSTEVVRNYEDIPPIRCLPDELNQVWTNLIHNALQAMDHKGTLTIGIRKTGNEAVVSVGDSGTGIPEEIRSKIFDVFFTTKPAGVGSGLGLDIVKKIIDKHKGRIEVQSEVGVGTTFLVYLPYGVPTT